MLDALSVQTAPDGCRPIVWMIIGMIKAHPTQHRMPSQTSAAAYRLPILGHQGRRQRHNASMTERKSYKDDAPGSRQAPCLGCGRRVVTARDPHVEIGGKRDGSVLMMYEAEPLRALATNPEQVFQPGLELLGVAHRACLQLARQRLEAQQVDLPDELPRLIVDREVGELPALHLPPPPGRCGFCRATDVTDEHVWPRWISRQLGGHDGFTMPSPHGPRRTRSLDITASVCVTCNNRWLSVLERDIQPILGPLIDGKERTLAPHEQRLLLPGRSRRRSCLTLEAAPPHPDWLLLRPSAASVPAPGPGRLARRLPRLPVRGLVIASAATCWDLDQRAAKRLCQHLHGLPSRLPGGRPPHPRQHARRRPTVAGRRARTYLAAT
jgi:hypothetical protein